ncbi:MAG: hypothetical protein WDN69_03035 [Aliidongia sp.]
MGDGLADGEQLGLALGGFGQFDDIVDDVIDLMRACKALSASASVANSVGLPSGLLPALARACSISVKARKLALPVRMPNCLPPRSLTALIVLSSARFQVVERRLGDGWHEIHGLLPAWRDLERARGDVGLTALQRAGQCRQGHRRFADLERHGMAQPFQQLGVEALALAVLHRGVRRGFCRDGDDHVAALLDLIERRGLSRNAPAGRCEDRQGPPALAPLLHSHPPLSHRSGPPIGKTPAPLAGPGEGRRSRRP